MLCVMFTLHHLQLSAFSEMLKVYSFVDQLPESDEVKSWLAGKICLIFLNFMTDYDKKTSGLY